MRPPAGSPDLEAAKLQLKTRFRNYENHLNEEIHDLANSGFADARLCAIAKTDLEKCFLALEKALRIGAPDDYAKQPAPPGGNPFPKAVDPYPTEIARSAKAHRVA